ncbi:MAG: hypothetical protein HQL58_03920 [Magnetococcales bacterium]|nr:hypothetical protein [Magnetococcales bacterium]
MGCYRLIIAVCLILLAIWSGNVLAGEKPQEPITEVRMGSTYADKANSSWEVFRRVFQPLGIQFRIEQMPYTRSYADMLSGKLDAQTGYFVQWNNTLHPRWHYLVAQVHAYYLPGSVKAWQGYRSLAGKRLGWETGNYFNLFFKEKIPFDLMEVKNLGQCLSLLQIRRVDFCLEENVALELGSGKEDWHLENYDKGLVFQEPAFLRLLDTPRSRQIVEIFDRRMDELYRTGELQQLFQRLGLQPSLAPEQRALANDPSFDEEARNGNKEWDLLIRSMQPVSF